MKNSITHITGNILLTFILVAVCFSVNVSAQTLSSRQSGTKSTLPAYAVMAGGFYPASDTLVQALSTINTDSIRKTTVTQGSSVHFTAREKIILNPGFKAVEGSKFIADVTPYIPASQAQNLAITNDLSGKYIGVSPNPFRNSFIISINAEKNCKAQIAVYNLLSEKVRERDDVNIMKGFNTISIDGSNLVPGTYVLEINLGGSKYIYKIIKTN